ncbi:MAG: FAD-dependent oxidoreductase [Marinovum algicola]|uniref:NAD(P)/FAD-dependent oxidoreductase n=1 Tax=Roseobacteraceae TaxID=2854170 RepID=UPI0032EB5190
MTAILIIGAGECGVRAAFALREQGFDGTITLIGEEATLPYERPPLSKDPASAPKPIRSEAAYGDAGIDLRLGTQVSRVDTANRSVILGDGETLAYDKLLLATGARARLFPGMQGCLTLRSDGDAAAIQAALTPGARIGIIGGGFIGLELAATARRAAAEVTVIEAGSRLLGRAVPQEIAAVVSARHAAEGVRLRVGTGVAATDARRITLNDGTALDFDAVIAGVGALPETALAEAAGITVDNGIVVDGQFRTSDRHVFAAGDCCNFQWRGARVRLESWKAAQDQGAHVAAAMLGNLEPYTKVPWFWSDQYDLTLQVAGLFDMTRPVIARDTKDATRIVFQCDTEGCLSAAAGIGPGNAIAKDLRILEKLIERGAKVDPDVLADPSQNLKRHLKAA